MITGNKGEWSEFYTFIKLLAERKLDAADENLQKLTDIFYPILKVIREDQYGSIDYELCANNKVKIIQAGTEIDMVDSSDLKIKVGEIFQSIKNNTETTFTIPLVDELMSRFHTNHLCAGNTKKEDVTLSLHDNYTGTEPEVGFSIKSMLGAASTLLNASPATNFIFKISGLDVKNIPTINAIDTRSKVRDRVTAIIAAGGSFSFIDISSIIFKKNLRLIEYILPEIVAQLILAYYSDKSSALIDLVEKLGEGKGGMLNLDLSHSDYEFKIKDLLYDVALGMVPGRVWDGRMRAHGGYIIVREDGEIVCYHVYNADAFRTYLFNNTKFETPSTGRHKFGKIYSENGSLYIKLNLQIRFIR